MELRRERWLSTVVFLPASAEPSENGPKWWLQSSLTGEKDSGVAPHKHRGFDPTNTLVLISGIPGYLALTRGILSAEPSRLFFQEIYDFELSMPVERLRNGDVKWRKRWKRSLAGPCRKGSSKGNDLQPKSDGLQFVIDPNSSRPVWGATRKIDCQDLQYVTSLESLSDLVQT